MQMKMREMGMKNRNFKKSSSYSSKKIESKIEIVGPPFGSACQLLGGGGIVTKLMRFHTGVYTYSATLLYTCRYCVLGRASSPAVGLLIYLSGAILTFP
jgi:hypothetical protein